jgi:TatD DNase family protein
MKPKAKSWYFDTHAHVNFSTFKDDADEVIKRSLEAGVFMINVGSQYSTSKRAVEMAEKYGEVYPHTKDSLNTSINKFGVSKNQKSGFGVGVYAAVGLHPIHLVKRKVNPDDSELSENDFETTGEVFDYKKYLELAKNPKVVAIGEMGLDYHHFEPGDNIEDLKKKQEETFLQGIKLANESRKPVIIHCWDAYNELHEILKNNEINKRGVIHSFIGSYKTAGKFIELGYKIGLNGVITYSDSFDRLIKEIDLKDIVVETDCPYLTPVPKKGERNEPINVKYVAEKIAEIKEIEVQEVASITTENTKTLFSLNT